MAERAGEGGREMETERDEVVVTMTFRIQLFINGNNRYLLHDTFVNDLHVYIKRFVKHVP